MLILSAPLNERKGWTNPYHKQVWTDESIKRLLKKFFVCEYYYQFDTHIDRKPNDRLMIAVCAEPVASASVLSAITRM